MFRLRQRATGSYTLTLEPLDDDGAPITVAAPYTVEVVDGAGSTAHTGSATYLDGVLSADVLVAAMPLLDTYTVTWTGEVDGQATQWVDQVELVGGYLFELKDLRARDRAFADTSKYPTALLDSKRLEVEETLESQKAAAVAFVPRGRRVTLDGSGRAAIALPDLEVREVYSVTVNGVALTVEELDAITIDDAWLHLESGVWPTGVKNVTVHYAHGLDAAPPPITRAALTLAREYLAGSDLPGRATATSIGDQMYRLTIAGRDGVTGLPEIDAAIDQHGRKRFRIG